LTKPFRKAAEYTKKVDSAMTQGTTVAARRSPPRSGLDVLS